MVGQLFDSLGRVRCAFRDRCTSSAPPRTRARFARGPPGWRVQRQDVVVPKCRDEFHDRADSASFRRALDSLRGFLIWPRIESMPTIVCRTTPAPFGEFHGALRTSSIAVSNLLATAISLMRFRRGVICCADFRLLRPCHRVACFSWALTLLHRCRCWSAPAASCSTASLSIPHPCGHILGPVAFT